MATSVGWHLPLWKVCMLVLLRDMKKAVRKPHLSWGERPSIDWCVCSWAKKEKGETSDSLQLIVFKNLEWHIFWGMVMPKTAAVWKKHPHRSLETSSPSAGRRNREPANG